MIENKVQHVSSKEEMDQTRKVLFSHCNAYNDYLRVCPFDVFARGPESTHLLLLGDYEPVVSLVRSNTTF
jgi:hypothetical protein